MTRPDATPYGAGLQIIFADCGAGTRQVGARHQFIRPRPDGRPDPAAILQQAREHLGVPGDALRPGGDQRRVERADSYFR